MSLYVGVSDSTPRSPWYTINDVRYFINTLDHQTQFQASPTSRARGWNSQHRPPTPYPGRNKQSHSIGIDSRTEFDVSLTSDVPLKTLKHHWSLPYPTTRTSFLQAQIKNEVESVPRQGSDKEEEGEKEEEEEEDYEAIEDDYDEESSSFHPRHDATTRTILRRRCASPANIVTCTTKTLRNRRVEMASSSFSTSSSSDSDSCESFVTASSTPPTESPADLATWSRELYTNATWGNQWINRRREVDLHLRKDIPIPTYLNWKADQVTVPFFLKEEPWKGKDEDENFWKEMGMNDGLGLC